MIWIFDRWTESDRHTYAGCFENGERNTVIALQDDGFLPAGAVSPYRYFVQEALGVPLKEMEEAPLFADLLEVPELWEICMDFRAAEILDEGIKKAEIQYAEPIREHNTKCVSWMGPDGAVYQRDCYDKYGKLYYTELLDAKGAVDVRTYYAGRKPVLVYQPRVDTYSWFRNGKMCGICPSSQEFLKRFLRRYFPEERNFLSDNIAVVEALSETWELPIRMNGNVLILTNSDRVEHLEELVSALPELHFHVGALTRMSDKLHRLEKYANVSLYPGISQRKRSELLIKSTFYLDINHYQEICDAVPVARQYGLLVAGFGNTLHHRELVLPECVFQPEDPGGMIRFLKAAYGDRDMLSSALERQKRLLTA